MAMNEAEKKRAQREKARLAGLCIVCRKQKPAEGKVVCAECNESAKERVARSRG